ncbi:YhjD/YihY/BrkB family envelope integrity protein [Caballeronia concitans]|uniref:Putative ribonuclease BN n=1 Tax=Caballeronia concitans TaxID=1777133 RepID=A0A658R581_9BURK|nr:YhjD/YihY/BrkB family envelope integrity protein [Caballeronia concitans]KIG08861.1 ribonuclease BN [Burkholderia sp. MR1]SAL51875.1 putative ribonuclease BN [Caballeronia concitans]
MSSVSTQKLEAAVKKDASWALSALKQFSENRCAAMAASIAFYSAFSLAPTLVMVIAVAGWVFGPEAARGQLFHQVNGLIGDQAAAGVQSIVENAHRSGGTGIAAIISFVLLAVGASATFSSLNTALNIVWPMTGEQRSSVMALVRVRLVSFGLVLGVAFLLIVSLVLDTAIQAVGMWLWGESPFVIIGDIVQLVVGLAILSVAFGGLLKFLPDAPVQWRDALVGGLIAALLFSAGKKLFAFYLTHAGTASAFGAAGSLAVLLMWLYFSAAVLLLGAEFSAARARMHDPRGPGGVQTGGNVPPGSRAKIGSMLAGSTRVAVPQAAFVPADAASPSIAPSAVSARQPVRSKASTVARAIDLSRKIARAESTATRATAIAMVGAGRKASNANAAVKRHPWRAVLVAASAGMAVAMLSKRDSPRRD